MNSPRVYWMTLNGKETLKQLADKTRKLLALDDFKGIVKRDALVGVKQHFGEASNTGYIRPEVSRVAGEFVKAAGGKPLLIETNTLYKGRRSNSYDHLVLAYEHGFTYENTGMPIAFLDGVYGQNQRSVAIPGKHFQSVNVVSDLPFFDSLIVLSHVKGHLASGMAGAIKNLAMGLSSRAGKLAQHANFCPEIDESLCIRCELCGHFCPADALSLKGNSMTVDRDKCIGCGECHAVCRYDAITFSWGSLDLSFQEKMVEHALGAVIDHKGKAIYINFFDKVSKFCDCWGEHNPPVYSDVGIFASIDPVAVDQACYDEGIRHYGKDVFRELWPEIDATIQMRHGEEIGLGSQKYELVEVK